MPRYIDAEKLKDDIAVLFERNEKLIDEWLAYCVDDVIDEQPTADVVERKKGKWIESNESALRPYMCSECGALFDVDTVLGKLSWQYCPACGTEMGEGREDDKR